MEILTESALEPKVGADVLSVAVRAATFDGVKPLSEQTVLDIGRMPAEVASDAQNRHLVVVDQPGEINASVLAYAHLERGEGEAASAEIVVHPDHRRQGHGGALLKALRELSPKVRVWSHGQTDAAKAFAEHFDLQVVRELLQMSRPLGPMRRPWRRCHCLTDFLCAPLRSAAMSSTG
ncbi:GNAT family N-acetyltransferase [Ornithinimicrobium sp. INDO-MA30-4]|uniref:GNAT family N-acetyltransferase n=1 Tax=Ornithinimicrobium sp. INDO-MA30-4 TaxID=2908651 RepID=UPI001F24BAE5|nr:GNAT family N-acetyltransferase [Ornithinimicrobium sp. INDO-MA30-4]UJH69634.1 GNAT family N-acetyltransferase [Ornithinimicrobium sp. INDO-MA30-4]